MFQKPPSISIDKFENLNIHARLDPFDPLWRDILENYLQRTRVLVNNNEFYPSNTKDRPDHEEPGLLKGLDYASRSVSIISGIAVVVFVALIWAGQTTIGNVQIANMLTVLSFVLVGGLISVGGVKMFSINASLRRARETVNRVVSTTGGCPYVSVVDDEAKRRYRITSPFQIGSGDFCRGCPLVDHNGRTICTVSPLY